MTKSDTVTAWVRYLPALLYHRSPRVRLPLTQDGNADTVLQRTRKACLVHTACTLALHTGHWVLCGRYSQRVLSGLTAGEFLNSAQEGQLTKS